MISKGDPFDVASLRACVVLFPGAYDGDALLIGTSGREFRSGRWPLSGRRDFASAVLGRSP